MPKEKDYSKVVPKIYKKNFYSIAMLFYVEGQKQIVPAVTIEQSLYSYAKLMGFDNFDVKSASVTLSRLRAEFIDLNYETT